MPARQQTLWTGRQDSCRLLVEQRDCPTEQRWRQAQKHPSQSFPCRAITIRLSILSPAERGPGNRRSHHGVSRSFRLLASIEGAACTSEALPELGLELVISHLGLPGPASRPRARHRERAFASRRRYAPEPLDGRPRPATLFAPK